MSTEFQWRRINGKPPVVGDYWESLGKSYYVHEVIQLEGMFRYKAYLEITDLHE